MIVSADLCRTNISSGPRKAIAVGNFNPSTTDSILILVSLPYISPSSLEKATLLIGEREVNDKIRLLAVSATYTLPDEESTAMPSGNLSCSSARPDPPPNFDMKVPLLENTWILLLAVSATYTLPDEESTAMPSGDLRVPLALPYPPHFDMKVPLLENTWILLLAVSATYTLPS